MPGIASATGAGANATYSAIGEQSYANRKERKLLRDDLKTMQNGGLGYSEAQRSQALAANGRQVQAQAADTAAQMQRAQNAAGGGRAGGYDTQRAALASGQQAAQAQFNTGVEQASANMAQNQRAAIYGRLAAQTGKNTAFWQRQGDIAQQGAENYSSVGGQTGGNTTGFSKGKPDAARADALAQR